ncbi:MAG TPA: protein kinase [Candidatus Acidoferrales bacterium]|nr:protein kinase [Candidatus Acidoferrales bacterium]
MQERWQEVKAILAGALERAPEERRVYLDQACTEPELRREVQSLIDAHEQAETAFMGQPFVGTNEILKSGAKLGPYEILARIGAGGMGVVYRARDGRLERDVAIKVLPLGLLTDGAARKRFRKEALALAKLNHPNVATVHDVGEQEGTDYLVMECVPGLALAEKLKSGALNEKEISALGAQIAAALEEAHEQNIIHRDLKPANVMVTPKGQAKVLDFGLAKLLLPFDTVTTQSFAESQALVGTLPYMAPEQLQGETVDARTDIHALGLVLYEMASGRRLFQRDSIPQLTDAILHQPPVTPRAFNARVSPELERIILKCLEKEPEDRYQSAKELGVDLRRLGAPSTVTTAATTGVQAPARHVRWAVLATGATLIAGAAAVGGYFYFHRAPKLTEKDSVVVADFANSTGDPVFDGTLRQGLSVQLQQTPFLRLVSGDQIVETLRLLEKPPGTKLTPDVAREVCQRVNGTAVIQGSIAALGSQFVLGLDALNCSTGELVAQEQVTAEGKEKVLAALGRGATQLRSKLGESAASLRTYDAPYDQAITTSSLEALQAYTRATDSLLNGDFASAITFNQRAVNLDLNFAQAYANLGIDYGFVGQMALAAENASKAYALRNRVSEREKFSITTNYHALATGDIEKEVQVAEQWAKIYPQDAPAYFALVGAYSGVGRWADTLAAAREALRLDPTPFTYLGTVTGYMNLGRLDEAQATIQQSEADHVDPATFRIALYYIAFLKGDPARVAELSPGPWLFQPPGYAEAMQSWTAAYDGHLAQARKLMERAVASARHQGANNIAASYRVTSAVTEALFGNFPEARLALKDTGQLSDFGAEGAAAVAWALAGDTAQATKLAENLNNRFPQATYVQFAALPAIRGVLALRGGKLNEATKAVDTISSDELGFNFSFIPPGVPAYVRGEVHLAAHQDAEAAADFQRILDHRAIILNYPVGALAHLGLARAYALQRDTAKAKVAYQDFLTLWKDADPDIPILKQARAEYAKLR